MHRQPDQAEHDPMPLVVPPRAPSEQTVATRPDGRPPLTAPASLLEAAMERVASGPATVGPATPGPTVPEPDSRIAALHEHLEEVQRQAAGASSWLETSEHYTHLLNSEGVVPVTARFDARDLAFLGRAREELLGFAELGLRLADLHRALDAGGTTSDPAHPAQRCRSCMWRWPCPTLRLMTEILTEHGGRR
jgi:hypothetical protein